MYKSTGSLWPLQLVFLLTLILGLMALFNPTLFGHQDHPDRTIGGYLLIAAVATAILLYAPGVWTWMHLPAAAGTIQETRDALRDGNQEKLDLIRNQLGVMAGQLNTIVPQINTMAGQLNTITPQINTIAPQINTIATQTNTIVPQINATAALFDDGGQVRQRLDAITAQFNAGGGVRTSLDAVKAKLGVS